MENNGERDFPKFLHMKLSILRFVAKILGITIYTQDDFDQMRFEYFIENRKQKSDYSHYPYLGYVTEEDLRARMEISSKKLHELLENEEKTDN